MLLGTVAWLMLAAARKITDFGLVVALMTALDLTETIPYLRARASGALIGAGRRLSILATAIGWKLVHDEHARVNDQPAAAIAAIRKQPGPNIVFYADFAWCDLFFPQRDRVILDGHADLDPQQVWPTSATSSTCGRNGNRRFAIVTSTSSWSLERARSSKRWRSHRDDDPCTWIGCTVCVWRCTTIARKAERSNAATSNVAV